jgi:glycosyltransferase involved in cell wall biosynthesis
MRVLWFNWRDIRHPEAGGAELFTHEVMLRLVKRGYDMTLYCAQFLNSPKTENIDGVEVIRDGGKYSVYNKAKNYYRKHGNSYDFVIDEVNTRPFLTPKFVKGKPILALYHSLTRRGWFHETFFPINYIGYYYLERKWLSYYKDVMTVTVSNSSKEGLESMGLKKILIVPEGVSVTPLSRVPVKASTPLIVFVGRLKRHKLPQHAIEAFTIIKKEVPSAKLWIIGEGYLRKELEKLGVKDVTFLGHVKDELKFDILRQAHLILVPATLEGWGLVVTESNAMGTPAVAYDVAGLRDSIIDGKTGILVKDNSPESLARSAISLLNDPDTLSELSFNALSFSRNFSWDNTAQNFDKILRACYRYYYCTGIHKTHGQKLSPN